jgi:hypothetical protein
MLLYLQPFDALQVRSKFLAAFPVIFPKLNVYIMIISSSPIDFESQRMGGLISHALQASSSPAWAYKYLLKQSNRPAEYENNNHKMRLLKPSFEIKAPKLLSMSFICRKPRIP